MNRASDARAGVFVKALVGAHSVHLGGAWEDQALAVLHAVADHAQVLFKVQFKDAQWVADVFDRCSDGYQRQHHIALANVEFNPFAVDGNIAFNKVEAWMLSERSQVLLVEIHTVDLKAVVLQETLGQMAADETVDAQDQDLGGLLLA